MSLPDYGSGSRAGAKPTNGKHECPIKGRAISNVELPISPNGHGMIAVPLRTRRCNNLDSPLRAIPVCVLQQTTVFVADMREALPVQYQIAAPSEPAASWVDAVDGFC